MSRGSKKRGRWKPCKEGERRCGSCMKPLPIEAFAWSKRSGFRCVVCPECQEKATIATLKSRYGLSPDGIMNLYIKQNGRCGACDKVFNEDNPPEIDHCHKSGKLRELLCRNCNLALGLVDDSIDLLQKLMLYLIKHTASAV